MITYRYNILETKEDETGATIHPGTKTSSTKTTSTSTSLKKPEDENKTIEYGNFTSSTSETTPMYTDEQLAEKVAKERERVKADPYSYTNAFNRSVQRPDKEVYDDQIKRNERASKLSLIGQMAQLAIDMGGAYGGANVWQRYKDTTTEESAKKNDDLLAAYRKALTDYETKKYEANKQDNDKINAYRDKLMAQTHTTRTGYSPKPTEVKTSKSGGGSTTITTANKTGVSTGTTTKSKSRGGLRVNANGNYVLPIKQGNGSFNNYEIPSGNFDTLVNQLKTQLKTDPELKDGLIKWMNQNKVWTMTGKMHDSWKGKNNYDDTENRLILEFIMQNGNDAAWRIVQNNSSDPNAGVTGIRYDGTKPPQLGFADRHYEIKVGEYDRIKDNEDYIVVFSNGTREDKPGEKIKKVVNAVYGGDYERFLKESKCRIVRKGLFN